MPRATAAASIRSAASPLLNWWLTSMPAHGRFPLEAERSFAIATASNPFSAARQQRDARDDRRDRDMAVQRARAVQLGQARVKGPAGEQPRQPRGGDGAGDRRRVADGEQRQLEPGPADDLQRDGRVLAAADRHQHPLRIHRRGRGAGAARGAEPRARRPRQRVGVGELAEPLAVEGLEQRGRGRRRRAALAADGAGRGDLVVADARDPVQKVQQALHSRELGLAERFPAPGCWISSVKLICSSSA